MSRVSRFLAVCTLATAGVATPNSPAIARQHALPWDDTRLARWFNAVEQHEPGLVDSTLIEVAAWDAADLRRLWMDVQILLLVVEDPSRTRFGVRPLDGEASAPSRQRPTAITVRRDQRKRLDEMAGRVRVISANVLLERAAMLHTDAATLAPPIAAAAAGPTSADAPLFMKVGDGRSLGVESVSLHWELARRLLGAVSSPDPRAQAFVRAWYLATLAVGQHAEQFDTPHLDAARRALGEDAAVLFLAGCEHEAFASPLFQEFARSFRSLRMQPAIASAGRELAQAERLFRRALAVDPDHVEARLRLGRVLSLRERPRDAVTELTRVVDSSAEPLLEYYAALFLGDAHAALGELGPARGWFERAAATMPGARVPHLALARVARELGDRDATAASLARALAVPSASAPMDPWWGYRGAQGRHGLSQLDALRASLKRGRP